MCNVHIVDVKWTWVAMHTSISGVVVLYEVEVWSCKSLLVMF